MTEKQVIQANINLLESRIKQLKEIIHSSELGIQNLTETLESDKKYLASL